MSYCIPILKRYTGDPHCRLNPQHRELVKIDAIVFSEYGGKK